jgi:hypothetical protein
MRSRLSTSASTMSEARPRAGRQSKGRSHPPSAAKRGATSQPNVYVGELDMRPSGATERGFIGTLVT